MPRYYMRVDAVNLANFVYDTHDISTIRGGSYLLLQAIENIATEFQNRLSTLTTAASQGLFSFYCDESDNEYIDRLQLDVLKFLQHQTEGHATFLIASEKEIDGNFNLILEKLEAQIHRKQWRMPTIAVPEYLPTNQECYLDGWRPGLKPYLVDPDVENVKISASTNFRRMKGREIKHKIFYDLLGEDKYRDNLCARDLGELAISDDKGVLSGKIAFIHLDGNNFGQFRRELCTSEETRSQFDKAIQDGFRKPFLKALLTRADKDPGYQTYDLDGNQALRIEVLLWGGDEMTLVVPAWKGLEVLHLFFARAKNLAFNGNPLSHRAAIIFCHHNAPILQIRALADSLLSRTKRDIQDRLRKAFRTARDLKDLNNFEQEKLVAGLSDHRYGDAAHYLVLESFDMLRGTLDYFISHYYGANDYNDLLIYAHEFNQIRDHILIIRKNVSKGNVLDIVQAIQKGETRRVSDITSKIYALLPADRRTDVQTAIAALTHENLARWYLVSDLWDYIQEWTAL